VRSGAARRFGVDLAVADVDRALGCEARAFQAQAHDVGWGLGADLVTRARHRVEHALQAKMANQSVSRGRAVGGERHPIAAFQFEQERP
jgi:hypothetical protein